MLSYYISWHMQARLAALLFTDDDKPAASAARTSPVAPAALPVHSFATVLADLATICLNTIAPADPALPSFRLVTTPTTLQRQAFELLGVSHRLGVACSAARPGAARKPRQTAKHADHWGNYGLARSSGNLMAFSGFKPRP